MEQKQYYQYGAIDLAKFICALLIVTAHYITENAEGRVNVLFEYGVSIYIIVVPFFFACSGYFLFKKVIANPNDGKKIIKSYLQRILIIYGGWSIVYILFKILTWIRFGLSIEEIWKYLLNAVFFSSYKTIWFLPALCVGIILTFYFSRRFGEKAMLIIALAFYLFGALGVSYSFILNNTTPAEQILNGYNYVFASTRNGIFYGFPFVTIGLLIAKEDCNNQKKNTLKYFILAILFGIMFVVEAFILKFKFYAINANTLLFLLPFTYCFVRLCLGIPWKANHFFKWMRIISTTIFLCQRIFLSALPELFPYSVFSKILQGNAYIGLIYVLCSTFVLSEIVILLSRRSKIIAALC